MDRKQVRKIGDVAGMPVQVEGFRSGSLKGNLSGSCGDHCKAEFTSGFQYFCLCFQNFNKC